MDAATSFCETGPSGEKSNDLFSGIRHFKPEEFRHPDKLSAIALTTLDTMRDREGDLRAIYIVVNEDFAPGRQGHAEKSRHYFGDAFDIVIKDSITRQPLPLLEQFLIAIRYCWTGIGVYPFWNLPGLHVDTRPMTRQMRRALWMRDRVGVYQDIKEFFDMVKGGEA